MPAPEQEHIVSKTFPSSDPKTDPGRVHINLWPDIPQVEIYTDGGRSCILIGEDLGKFIAWMKEQNFHA